MLSLLLLLSPILAIDVNREILPADCDCRDWYGGCRRQGESWIDEGTWKYQCQKKDGSDAALYACMTSSKGDESEVGLGENRTIEGLWHSCTADDIRVKYETEPHCLVEGKVKRLGEKFREGRFEWLCLSTGRWVVGCYYANETTPDVYLNIGEKGRNGLIEHVCDRFEDYPGRVQYYSQVAKDVHVKHPTNKGINKNFPEPLDATIKEQVPHWLHESASSFIENDVIGGRVRYLPASRKPWENHL